MTVVDQLLTELNTFGERLPAAIAELERQRHDLDEQIKRLRALERALHPSTNGTAPEKPSPSHRRSKRDPDSVSSERLLFVADAALTFEQSFTAQDLMAKLGYAKNSTSSVYPAIHKLRQLQFLRRAEKVPPRNGIGHASQSYRVLDAHALDNIRAEFDGQAQ